MKFSLVHSGFLYYEKVGVQFLVHIYGFSILFAHYSNSRVGEIRSETTKQLESLNDISS